MFYDRKKDEGRTNEVNSIFKQIAYLNKVSGQNEPGQNNNNVDLSGYVGLRMPSSNLIGLRPCAGAEALA